MQRASSAGQAEGDGLTRRAGTVTQARARLLQMKLRPRRLRQAFNLSQSQEILAGNLTTVEQGKALGNTGNQARPLVMLDS